ncbi:uncharacterized protein Tco025E_02703 [Trypanosoma conorhini]|uniref:Uncharacterized protein n=1 Tax=Trypanosoma conorhini TaxID=83891 RepID=A0A422Q1D4_9TRYP|nr:uncharacterized protein Tco025E_02703 [Trypanosoma conorhini]RNF23802.1 hypothetical protein Tco025E_02703 [Trypanosoma conorhini]
MFTVPFTLAGNAVAGFSFSSSTTVEEVVARRGLSPYLQSQPRNGKEVTSLKAFVGRCLLELVQVALRPLCGKADAASVGNAEVSSDPAEHEETRDQKQTLFSENATELITFYLGVSEAPEMPLSRIVTATLPVLVNAAPLTPLFARCFQRIILKAFDVDAHATTAAIAARLDKELLLGVIRHISASFVVSETFAALFETTLQDTKPAAFSTVSPVFIEACVRLGFAEHLASHMAVALRTETCQPYFSFWKALVNHGYSQTAGPIVDELLKYELMSVYVRDILRGCEEARASPGAVPLAAQGVEVYRGILALVRTSLVPADVAEMYSMNVSVIAPIKLLTAYFRRFCDLIPVCGAAAPSRADAMRIALCAMFVEVLSFRLRDTDRIIAESNFLQSLLAVSLQYPNCYCLSVLLQRSLLSIFSGRINDTDDVLLRHLAATENARKPGLLAGCVELCTEDRLRRTSLAALMVETWRTLAQRTLLADSCETLRHAIELFSTNRQLQERIQDFGRPITGEGFAAAGSGSNEEIHHRPCVYHVSRQRSVSLNSFSSPTDPGPSFAKGGAPDGGRVRADAYLVGDLPGTDAGGEAAPPEEAISDAAFSVPEGLLYDAEDSVAADLAWDDEVVPAEVSPQARAYPRFADVRISFEVREEAAPAEPGEPGADAAPRRRVATENLEEE